MGQEQTETGRCVEPQNPVLAPLVWKLRTVYVGGAGIVELDERILRGLGPLTLCRGAVTSVAGRRMLLADRRISREHARIWLNGPHALLKDLGSKNGTAVNGRLLPAGEAHTLGDGDVIRLGDSFVVVRQEPATVPDTHIPMLVGLSQAACKLRSAAAQYAPSDCPVLLLGETGTGKGAAAAVIHALSRRPGRFVTVNCAAIPATLAEGMLFGVRKGAFTGAVEQVGFFGEAQSGTLFLDEIGELPVDLQAKLLQALESKLTMPLGHTKPLSSDVRIIAATNRDLPAALRAGSFRQDLYHRIAALVIQLPTLRERREDVLVLAAHLAQGDFHPSPALVAAMLGYAFPGNVREAANLVCRARTVGEADVIAAIRPQSPALDSPGAAAAGKSVRPSPWNSGDPPPARATIVGILSRHQGNLSEIERESGRDQL